MTITRPQVQQWLNAYIGAWRSYDPAQIGALFSADAVVYYTPYATPVMGRDAIIASWLDHPDAPDSWKADYWPHMIEENRAVTRGTTTYYEDVNGQRALRAEFDNVFMLTFNDAGEVSEFREWYFRKPDTE
jgi:hypothetical protein